jgi:hypothetical protein
LGEKELSAIFLSFLMVLTPLANAYVFGSFMQQPKVFTQSFAKTVEVGGKKFELRCLSKLTQYPNGTELFEGSVTIENVSKHIPRLRVNLTKVVTPEELSLWKGETTNKESVIYPKTGLIPNSYQFFDEQWDNLWFVVSSPQIWIKYKHDDNYQYYHPWNFNEPWEFKPHDIYNGTHLYNEKFHTHMSIDDVYDWYTGAKSDEEIMAKYVKGTQLGINIIGIALAALITLKFGSSVLGILLDAVVAALVLLFNWLLEVLGISNKSKWIQNVVMAEQGDGFFWSWGFHTTSVDAWIIEPPIWYIGPGLSWDVYQRDLETLAQYHRIDVVMHETREFYRTWGSQRDASPETLTTELWYELTLPAGVLTDYGFYGCYK